jgi:pyruvate/2-oxoglutarate dehydrogenase complex dihydrolipoamide dehydrogenase (E3) component
VVGAGQGGGPLAGAFARAGRRTAVIERVHVGGTCVNEGCSPTKTMVASARVAQLARRDGDAVRLVGERQRHPHALRGHAPPAVRQQPQQDQDAGVDARHLRDRALHGQLP